MTDERHDENQDLTTDLENVEVTELDDQELEDASGGLPQTGNNLNCGCS
jgi:hypothetical protein